VVLYGYENWSLILNKELKLLENRELRRIFGPKRHNIIGGWPSQHNEQLHNLYSYPNVIGARGSVVVKALCCKPEGRGFKSR
jgi:hypothetical protein